MRRDSELLDSIEHDTMNVGPASGSNEVLDVDIETLKRMQQISAQKYRDRKYAESLELQQVVYQTHVRLNGERDPATLLALGNIAATLSRLRQLRQAEETFRARAVCSGRSIGG